MFTRFAALVVLLLGFAFAAPARASEAPTGDELAWLEADLHGVPQPVRPYGTRRAWRAGLVLALTGPAAAMVGGVLVAADCLSFMVDNPCDGGWVPGIAMVGYGVVATPLGLGLTLGAAFRDAGISHYGERGGARYAIAAATVLAVGVPGTIALGVIGMAPLAAMLGVGTYASVLALTGAQIAWDNGKSRGRASLSPTMVGKSPGFAIAASF